MKTSEPQKIVIFPIGTYERNGWFTREILEFAYSLPYNMDYHTKVIVAHNFIPAAAARNHIAKMTMQMEPQPDWVCMIDNDMSPPINILDTVKDAPEDAAVVIPKFFLWDEDKKLTRICWGLCDPRTANGNERHRVGPGFTQLQTCGTGVVFIRPEVFQKVPPPWFFYTFDQDGKMTSTEDINFCLKIAEYGMKIYGNGSHEVGHWHSCNLSTVAEVEYRNSVSKPELEKV